MMTSVTLSSSSGAIHGGYSSVAGGEAASSSEPDYDTTTPSTEATPMPIASTTLVNRSVKRCWSVPQSVDSCKKRRKQATPIRISAAELDEPSSAQQQPQGGNDQNKVASPEPDVRCPVCQLYFDTSDQLHTHIISDHPPIECKREVEELTPATTPTPQERSEALELTLPSRNEVQWLNELQTKEWKNPNSLASMAFNPPPNPMFMALPQFVQSDTLPRQPIRIFNPDAYCDLCNKEFCNKYFLKTHKANKHGIYTDTPASEPVPSSCVSIPSFAGNIKPPPPPTSVPSVDISFIKSEPKLQTTILNPFSDSYPFSSKSDNSNGFPYPAETAEPTNKKPEEPPPQPRTDDESSSPNLPPPPTESTSFKNELPAEPALYYETPKLSPGSQNRELDLSNRLRKIGVMNPKAFCEICCKEYCNKYFLRTHKMKRHGIYIPDDRDKDMKLESSGFPNFGWPPTIQTSPLNLIMTEQQSSTDRKTTSPNDISCDLCGIKFQNASLAQLHNISVHGKLNEDDKKLEPSSEAISEDLQKLQTMILQLNDLDMTKVYRSCNSCNKEFENRYHLHVHMMTEHGILLDEQGEPGEKQAESENSSNNNTMSELGGANKEAPADEIKTESEPKAEDFAESFSMPDKSVARMSSGSGERRISMNVTPTSSYCDICNKELCNKYFMKTHMQRMHGIEIENGAQIGGVVCDICNKELCSKYFLRVHKHNTHGIVEYGSSLLQPRKSEGEPPPPQGEPDPALKPADLADLSHRYFSHFTEVCTICSRRFRSTKWLKAHLLSDHGQAGSDKWAELEQQLQQSITSVKHFDDIKLERCSPTIKIPNGGGGEATAAGSRAGIQNVLSSLFGVDDTNAKSYQCSYCSFTTTILPLLFVHERSHSVGSNGDLPQLKCPACSQSFLQPELLQHHLFTQHPFLPLPPFFNGNNNTQGELSKEETTRLPSSTSEDCTTEDPMAMATTPSFSTDPKPTGKQRTKPKTKVKRLDFGSGDIGQSLKDVAKRAQLPATYALPHDSTTTDTKPTSDDPTATETAGYVMQAFLLEESAPVDRRVVPAVVFLPVVQKQPAPLTVTFTLTPA